MPEPIISVSGLRGIVGESLTPEVASRYALAFAAELAPGAVLLSGDGRASGPMLAAAIRDALLGAGRDVLDAKITATPTAGVLIRAHGCAGGVEITASHNPPEYNGMKLFDGEGRVIAAAAGERVLNRYRHGKVAAAAESPGSHTPLVDTISAHWKLIQETIDVDRIAGRGFRVLFNPNHGAGCEFGSWLLSELGCELAAIGDEPDGCYEHPPEPTAENLRHVLPQVKAHAADIGFCTDPDADRLAVIDEVGRYLGEEYTLAMCAAHVLTSRSGPVVTNCSTSRMAEDVAERFGVRFFRSKVGEANVCDLMIETSAVIGGEGNGGVIDPRVGYVRDSFVAMALLLDAMSVREKKISELAAELPRYEIVKTKVPLAPEKLGPTYAALEDHFADAQVDRLDGLRLDWPGAWLLIRPSNTEPIVRIIAEAATSEAAEQLCEQAAACIVVA